MSKPAATPSHNASHPLWAGLVSALQWLTIVLFALLTLDVLWGVVSRYVLARRRGG